MVKHGALALLVLAESQQQIKRKRELFQRVGNVWVRRTLQPIAAFTSREGLVIETLRRMHASTEKVLHMGQGLINVIVPQPAIIQ